MTQIDVLTHLDELTAETVEIQGEEAEFWLTTAEVADRCSGDQKEVSRALLAAVRSRRASRYWFREPGRGAACWGYRLNDRGAAYLDRYTHPDVYDDTPVEEDSDEWTSYPSTQTISAPPADASEPFVLPVDPVGFAFPKAEWTWADADAAAEQLAPGSGQSARRALESLNRYWRLTLRTPIVGANVTRENFTIGDGRPVVLLNDTPICADEA